ncbi:hypothetical protein IPZ69_02750 [Streptomyces olivochromogenes]|nr:hypothetical protein [Streptomyces olivochromogenes]
MPAHPPWAAGAEPVPASEADPRTEVIAGPGGGPEPGVPPRTRWRRRSARARAVAVAVTVAALALGGTVAFAATSGGSTSQAVPAAGSPSGSPSPDHRHGHGPGWFGLGGEIAHGEATVKDRDSGKWVVRAFQRGTVDKVAGDQVTVKSDDGTAWTWTVGSDTKVFGGGSSGSGAGALKKGDKALLAGTRSDSTRTAVVAVKGAFTDWGPDGGHGGFRGHGPCGGPWGGPDRTMSASPTGSGATT